MVWEYLVLGAVVGWAVFYLWRTFFRKGGCACGSCPSAGSRECPTRGMPTLCTTTEADGADTAKHPPDSTGLRPPDGGGKPPHKT